MQYLTKSYYIQETQDMRVNTTFNVCNHANVLFRKSLNAWIPSYLLSSLYMLNLIHQHAVDYVGFISGPDEHVVYGLLFSTGKYLGQTQKDDNRPGYTVSYFFQTSLFYSM